jgi:S-adenosylmethionine-diacylglycerol 3-amino-3-carboxypropyl transferase
MMEPALKTQVTVRRRLGQAVHRHRAISRQGLSERLFTMLFSGLVYPQIWEDPDIDLEALAMGDNCHIVTIASGGCNVMSYLAAGAKKISAVDLSPAHVALLRLKLAGAKYLPGYPEFHRFFAHADSRENIKAYRTYLRDKLDPETRAYWDKRTLSGRKRISLFQRNFYHHGVLGRFIGAAHMSAKLFGVSFDRLFECETLAEQRAFFDTHVAPIFERKILRWAVDHPAALFGLGIPPAQFHALAAGRDMHEVLRERLEHLICDFPIQENYFAWQAFARRYDDGKDAPLPPYLQAKKFDALRAGCDRATIENISVTELLRNQPEQSVNRVILLDAQDWMTDDQLNDLWTQITRAAKPGARVIFRTADKPSLLPGRVHDEILNKWHYHAEQSADWTIRDRSSIYGGFHLYSLI